MPVPRRSLIPVSGMFAALLLTGCGRAPSFNILGSYFPAWLVCILAGIAAASILRVMLAKFHKEQFIRWTILVYPCLAAAIAFNLWLLLFS
jgi:hypothetical protein